MGSDGEPTRNNRIMALVYDRRSARGQASGPDLTARQQQPRPEREDSDDCAVPARRADQSQSVGRDGSERALTPLTPRGAAPAGSWVEGEPIDLAAVVGDDRYRDARALPGGRRGPSARACRREDRVDVAVKLGAAPAPSALRKAFLAEAARHQALRSPHLVPILDAGVTGDGRPWLTTLWYPDGSFRAGGELGAVDDSVAAARQAAAGLAVLHAAGLVHANVTPPNVLIAGPGQVAVDGSSLPGLTPRLAEGEVAAHVPPEVIEGHAWDARGDVWALASCLFGWLRGQLPWSDAAGKGIVPWLLAVSTDPPARARRADVPAWLETLIEECLWGDPSARPTAAELADRLRGGPAPSRSATVCAPPPGRGPAPRQPLRPAGAGRRRRHRPGMAGPAPVRRDGRGRQGAPPGAHLIA